MRTAKTCVVILAAGSFLVAACSSDSSPGGSSPEGGTAGDASTGGGTSGGAGGTAGKSSTGGASGKSGGGAGAGTGAATSRVDAGEAGTALPDATSGGGASAGGSSASSPDAGTDASSGGAPAGDSGGGATSDAGADAGPAVTAIGNAIAGVPAASGSIGAAGGTLTSGDGQVVLTVPAGALSATTTIGIQAIDNDAPGGTGYAYRFTPNGLTFAKPVTLTFTPTYGQLDGSALAHVSLAFQDAAQKWENVPVTVDTGNKAIVATTTHFTDYAYLLNLALSGNNVLFTGQSAYLKVVEVDTSGQYASSPAQVNLTGNPKWLLDGAPLGNGSDGELDPLANSAAYTAPAKIPSTDPVAVSVSFTASNNAQVTLVQEIYILAHKYRLDVTITNDMVCGGGSGYSFDYSTMGSIDLSLDADFVVTSSNATAAVTPSIGAIGVCGSAAGLCTATAEPSKTFGLALSSVTGGWQPFIRRLALVPRGNASGMPAMSVSCGTAGSYEVTANNSAWNSPGYVGYMQGKDGETASQLTTTAAFTAGPSFKLTVITP